MMNPLLPSLLLSLPLLTQSVSVGDSICTKGFIMDKYCIYRERLLDNPSVHSLQHPDRHSVHCMVDVCQCHTTGYEILIPSETNNDNNNNNNNNKKNDEPYCRAFSLNENGNNLAVSLARRTGAMFPSGFPPCTTCTSDVSEMDGGGIGAGFRATVRGIITDMGNAGKNTPPTLSVLEVLPYDESCPSSEDEEIITTASECINRSAYNTRVRIHGSLMIVGWGTLLPSGVLIARFLKHREGGIWFKIHRVMQVLGLMVAGAGWVVALLSFSVFRCLSGSLIHGSVGMLVMCLGLLQPLNAFFRPHPPEPGQIKSKARIYWEKIHKGSGYTAVILSLINIVLGTVLVPEEDLRMRFRLAFFVGSGGWLILLVCGLFYDKRNYVGMKQDEVGVGKKDEEKADEAMESEK